MKWHCHKSRDAVAMIELIFAIVIMGIALMSAPRLISQAVNGGLSVVQQEAIVADATEIGMIMTRAWDEADTNDSDTAPILVVSEDIDALNEKDSSGKRVGIPKEATRSFVSATGSRLDATAIGRDANDGSDEYDDIDDFHDKNTTLNSKESTTTEDGDYIDNSLEMLTKVEYIKTETSDDTFTDETINYDSPFGKTSSDTTNIKMISTTITSGGHSDVLDTNITLRAFMCNIGTYTIQTRSF
jgi:hypothetical protein